MKKLLTWFKSLRSKPEPIAPKPEVVTPDWRYYQLRGNFGFYNLRADAKNRDMLQILDYGLGFGTPPIAWFNIVDYDFEIAAQRNDFARTYWRQDWSEPKDNTNLIDWDGTLVRLNGSSMEEFHVRDFPVLPRHNPIRHGNFVVPYKVLYGSFYGSEFENRP